MIVGCVTTSQLDTNFTCSPRRLHSVLGDTQKYSHKLNVCFPEKYYPHMKESTHLQTKRIGMFFSHFLGDEIIENDYGKQGSHFTNSRHLAASDEGRSKLNSDKLSIGILTNQNKRYKSIGPRPSQRRECKHGHSPINQYTSYVIIHSMSQRTC